jgi:hypothetical protein
MLFNHSPAFGFGHASRTENSKSNSSYSPGPGQYKTFFNGKKQPEWKIGTSTRKSLNENNTPGVGQYSLPNNFPSGPKYTISTKPNFSNIGKFITPGPGQYKTLKKSSSACYTIGTKLNHNSYLNSDKTPGPGNYNINENKIFRKSPSFKFGSEKRENFNINLNNPGPGNYNLGNIIYNKKPSYGFGKEKKGELPDEKFPGPGQYEIRDTSSGPKITIAQKLNYNQNEGKKDSNPAPGMYNIQNNTDFILHKSPSFKIGTSERKSLSNQENTPAPGTYNTYIDGIKNKSPSWKIGSSKRDDLNPKDNFPGVGNYNISKGIEKKKITMFGKGKDLYNNDNPGPGQYNLNMNDMKKNPSWKIGSSNRDDNFEKVVKENVPGPGQYDIKDNMNGPKFAFGKEKKNENEKSDVPGPGYYHIPCSIVDVNEYTRQQGKFDPYFKYV